MAFLMVISLNALLFLFVAHNWLHSITAVIEDTKWSSQSEGQKCAMWPGAWHHSFLGEGDNIACTVKPIYHDSSFKWLCVGCWHPITKLTIPHQSRRDTESCYLFFLLEIVNIWWHKMSANITIWQPEKDQYMWKPKWQMFCEVVINRRVIVTTSSFSMGGWGGGSPKRGYHPTPPLMWCVILWPPLHIMDSHLW